MNIEIQEITAMLLRRECGPGAYERGNSYFHQGRVEIIEVIRSDDAGIRLLTTTRGSGQRLYDQDIGLYRSPEGIEIEGFCDCPVGYNCKHVVAACLACRQREGAGRIQSGDASAFADWLERFQSPEQPLARTGGAAVDQLLYALEPGSKGAIEVNFTVARRKRDGRFGKGRRVTLATLGNHYQTPRYLQPIDAEIIALLNACNTYQWGGTLLRGAAGNPALGMMLDSGRAFWGEQRERPLRRGAVRDAVLKWENEGRMLRLVLGLADAALMVPVTPPLYIDPARHEAGAVVLPDGIDADHLHAIASAPPVPRGEAGRISRLLALHHPQLPTPEPVEITDLGAVPPVPRLTLHLDGSEPLNSMLALQFRYGGKGERGELLIDPAPGAATITRGEDGRLLRIHRDPTAESAAGERLMAEGLQRDAARPGRFTPLPIAGARQAALGAWFRFLGEVVPRLQAEGWQVEQAAESTLSLSRATDISAEVEESDSDWFGLRFDIQIGDRKYPLLPLISGLIDDYRPGTLPPTLYLPYAAGHYVEVAREQIEPILQNIIELFDSLGGGSELRLSRLDAPRLLELGDIEIRGARSLQRLAKKLRGFTGIKHVKPPSTFKGELRGYQQQGLNWLQFLREYELAGILADDMGLGKTVQTLAHLAVEKRAGRMQHPSLIIAPTSLMGNWRREATRFTPRLKVLVLHGPGRNEHFHTLDAYDLILTTYPLLPRDREVLLAQPCHYLILDEAQQIKNPRAQAAQLVRAIKANHRLCLTGTPMENHLGELWAQFDFLLPGFLGSHEQFTRRYRTPIEKQGDQARLQRLAQRTAPFMLRRTKDVVAGELPPKSELLRTVPIAGRQAALYESIRLTMEKKVRDAIAKKGLARSHITILDALLKLRQVCCDPRLLPVGTGGGRDARSAKLEMLMELLPELLEEGRRILLFSQFTSMLSLIEQALQGAGIRYCKLTGQTRKRDQVIDSFRHGEVDLFLISLKTGGVGLNLTEADTVIHYDPWWNPAVEMQATDRAHRIGQEKPVFVYKLITEGTVEEKILALQAKKQQLANRVYGKEKAGDELLLDAATISALLAADTAP
ncbi:DEAD/DEAH box helicase [Sedimenticola hydrogenitrophicus]|uniref:DEAD/DEAH box helicase n=1 Tax=Sedimenticola hydrogenitrophicus TaxID=2967975 RepID=UPI0023AECFBB|nr:DEAD/DEAH box helicase [Sedimenticola hydrogenitrophicus]